MSYLKQEVVDAIVEHIATEGGGYSNWYVGIASDPRERLFTEHKVKEHGGAWIFRECESSSVARDVEDHFVNRLGTRGGPGGGDYSTKSVYAYKIASHTFES